MKVYFRYLAKLSGIDGLKISSDTMASFKIGDVEVTLIPEECSFLLKREVELTAEEIAELCNTEKLYVNNQTSFKHGEYFFEKIRTILHYLKFFYSIKELNEAECHGVPEWSLDEDEWFPISMRFGSKWIPSGIEYLIPDSLLGWMPVLIERKIEPFYAFSFLHAAFREEDDKLKWIIATTAAELAFKEFLARFDKRTGNLITKIPSPPINFLYNKVLFDYTEEHSPFHVELQKGSEIRNNLIHTPNGELHLKGDVAKYLLQVQASILHLQYLLNKDVGVLKFFYEKALQEVESFK